MPVIKNFLSSGKKGDLLYQLYLVKVLGGGNLFITTGEFEEPLESVLESCGNLVNSQSYVTKFDIHRGEPIDYDLDAFRRDPYLYRTTLLDVICRPHGVKLPEDVKGWITVPADKRFEQKIVIHRRTSVVKDRGNNLFDWNALLDAVGRANCVFVSRLEMEWKEFGHPEIEYYCPKDNLEHACILSAARLFLGNTCFGTALAESVGVSRIIELSYGLDRKHFAVDYSPNAWYFASPWDCTIKNFRYIKKSANGNWFDLSSQSEIQTVPDYPFNIKKALAQEIHFRSKYHRYLAKRFIKQSLGLL